MTIALVQQRPIVSYVSAYAGVLSDSFAATPSVGDLVVVTGGSYNGSATFTVDDNQGGGNTWNVLQNDLADTTLFAAWCVVAVASGTFTVTTNLSSARRSATMQLSSWSLPNASPLGNYSIAGYSMVRSASTTEVGQLLIAAAGGNGTGGDYVNPPSTFTAMDEVNLANCTMATAYRLSSTIGSETATWTGTGPTDSDNSILVLFKPGAAGPTVTSVTQTSGGTEGSPAVMTVSLSGATSGSTNFAATLAGVTATGSGTDFTSDLASATYSNGVTFSGGNMVVPDAVSGWTVTIATTSDTLDEANETATLTIGGTAGTLTITDDDAAPTISVNDVTESAGSCIFTVSLSAASGKSITVDYATADGTSTAGVDYTAASGTLTFAAGETTKTVTVTVP